MADAVGELGLEADVTGGVQLDAGLLVLFVAGAYRLLEDVDFVGFASGGGRERVIVEVEIGKRVTLEDN